MLRLPGLIKSSKTLIIALTCSTGTATVAIQSAKPTSLVISSVVVVEIDLFIHFAAKGVVADIRTFNLMVDHSRSTFYGLFSFNFSPQIHETVCSQDCNVTTNPFSFFLFSRFCFSLFSCADAPKIDVKFR